MQKVRVITLNFANGLKSDNCFLISISVILLGIFLKLLKRCFVINKNKSNLAFINEKV